MHRNSSSVGLVELTWLVTSLTTYILILLFGGQDETQQLIHDKEELLGQVVSLQQQLETVRGECSRLTGKVCLCYVLQRIG